MKILGKGVSSKFQSFYEDIVALIGEPKFCRTRTPGSGDCRLESGVAVVRLCTDLSKRHFEQHAAHELLHALQLVEGWPRIRSRLPDQSAVVELGEMLQSIVLDLNVEDRLKQLPFESTWFADAQYRNLKKALMGNIPLSGSLPWCKGPMMCAYASLTQPPKRWNRLRELHLKRAPHILEKGEELIAIMRKHGWNNPDQALASMISMRDTLGFASDQLTIVDGRTGRRH